MPVTCYTTVSDLAVCQRCPALFAYIIHKRKKSAWRVGIEGGKDAYGSIFHKEISEKFFKIASDKNNPLHEEINITASRGACALEEFLRKNIFLPFIETKSKYFTSGQILSMAQASRIFINRISNFFENSRPVFMEPEGKLEDSYFSVKHNAELNIKGRYDALIFNPATGEARLFEFKGFKKSDITVPLSQSLIYSWLIEKTSGIIPSIEIIYLDEGRPEIFSSEIVKEMIISRLPGLFYWALDIILLRRMPEMFQDKNLCGVCHFSGTCKNDMKKIFTPAFKKRRGASMLTLLVFFFAATMITAQVFFFSNITAEAVKDDREILGVRLQLANLVEVARKNYLTSKGGEANWKTFKNLAQSYSKDNMYLYVYDLNYSFKETEGLGFDDDTWIKQKMYEKIFPPIPDHYLIRAYTEILNGKNLMLQVLLQVLVDSDGKIKTYEEIWY